MAGISSKAAGITPNKEKTFQGQRFDDELELNWVQFKWRNHDPQIGRFIEIDPLSEKYVYNSTYAFSENKVVAHIELEGLESLSIADVWRSGGITSNTEPKEFLKTVANEAGKPSTWFEAGAFVGKTAVPIVLTEVMTGGAGGPGMLKAEMSGTKLSTTGATTEVNLATRANEIQGALKSPFTQRMNTTAVASATTAEGNSVTLVGSNEKTLRPEQLKALRAGEMAVSGNGHAEVTILNHASANGMTVSAVAASRPICPTCATAITNAGAVPASPLKVIKPTNVASTYVKPPVTMPQRQ